MRNEMAAVLQKRLNEMGVPASLIISRDPVSTDDEVYISEELRISVTPENYPDRLMTATYQLEGQELVDPPTDSIEKITALVISLTNKENAGIDNCVAA